MYEMEFELVPLRGLVHQILERLTMRARFSTDKYFYHLRHDVRIDWSFTPELIQSEVADLSKMANTQGHELWFSMLEPSLAIC